ncbi:MAG: universal stress protein [Verrucomicrobia bacterium]|nr:universal stress protein [Verrucomicrobiota bacterium]
MKTTNLTNTNTVAPKPPTTARASRRILVPLDLTPDSQAALQYAARLAKEENTSVCLLHVVDIRPFKSAMTESPMYHSTAHIISRAERHLRMLARHELPPGVPVRILICAGNTAREVVKAAQAICADLIVLAAPRQNWLSRLLPSQPTRWIESHAPCSVVVLREANYGACDCSSKFEQPSAAAMPT